MTSVFLLIDEEKNVVAIYDNEEFALKLKVPIEEKLSKKIHIEKRTVNQDIKVVGVFK